MRLILRLILRYGQSSPSPYRFDVALDRHVDHVDERARGILWLALALNAVLLAAEVTGGLGFSSLALLADAAHQAADVVAIGVALVAQALVTRPGSARHTYGLRRAEALVGQLHDVDPYCA